MPRDLVELKTRVKAASDIVDVISGYIPVTPAGKIFKAVCPFHDDTKPSLQIDRKFQNYKCWACQAKGDAFTFVERFERVSFMEAMAILARRAGIALDDPNASPQDRHKAELFDVMRWTQVQYHEYLVDGKTEPATVARKYLGSRGLSGASVREFGLGFAPPDHGWIQQAAARDGVPPALLVEVGILGERDENRGLWDRFRDRVMFPIRDAQKRTVGFGGRILPDSPFAARGPKYYNTAETVLFKKQEQLYGIDLARHAGASAGFLAVVEGYTDVMMAHQCGVSNVVATMGTALNASHVAQLRRYVPKVVLVFDADAGGTTGVDRALEVFITHDVELAVAALPDGLDPADLLTKPDGAGVFKQVLASAVDALEFKLNQLVGNGQAAPTVDGAKRMLDAVLGIIAMAPPVPSATAQLKQDLMLTRLAHRLGVELRHVRGRLKELQTERRRKERELRPAAAPVMASAARVTAPPEKPRSDRTWALGRQLLQILLAEPGLVAEAAKTVPADRITHTGIARLIQGLYDLHTDGKPADLDGLRLKLLDRPDLVAAAMDNLDVGRNISERQSYFQKIQAEFARMTSEAEARSVKDKLSAAGADDTATLELLRSLQNRPGR